MTLTNLQHEFRNTSIIEQIVKGSLVLSEYHYMLWEAILLISTCGLTILVSDSVYTRLAYTLSSPYAY